MGTLPGKLPGDFAAPPARVGGLGRLDVENMKLRALVECAGEILYENLASLAPTPETAELFRLNGREETAHAHRVKKAIELLSGEVWALPPLAENPYAQPPPVDELGSALLEGLRQGELAGKGAYDAWAQREENAEVAELLRRNGHEEQRHGERVARVIELLAL